MKKIFILFSAVVIATAMQAEVVFNEEHNVAAWDAQQLPVSNYSVLAKAGAGDVIAITVSAAEAGGRICLQNTAWGGLGYDVYDVTPGVYPFVLTAEAAEEVKTNGLIVTGEKYTFDKVELLYQKTLWTGELGHDEDWAQGDELSKSIFEGLAAGDWLGFSVSNLTASSEWHSYTLRVNWETNVAEGWISSEGTHLQSLSAEDVALLQGEAPVVLVARFLTINAVHTYVPTLSETPTAFGQTAASSLDNRRFNILGQPVDENYKGIVIINGRKSIQK